MLLLVCFAWQAKLSFKRTTSVTFDSKILTYVSAFHLRHGDQAGLLCFEFTELSLCLNLIMDVFCVVLRHTALYNFSTSFTTLRYVCAREPIGLLLYPVYRLTAVECLYLFSRTNYFCSIKIETYSFLHQPCILMCSLLSNHRWKTFLQLPHVLPPLGWTLG